MNTIVITIPNTDEPTRPHHETSYAVIGGKGACYDDCGSRLSLCSCDGEVYFQPVVDGDILSLQFNIHDSFNPNPQSPIYGWRHDESSAWLDVNISDCDGNVLLGSVILNNPSIIQGYAVGYDNGSYQNLNINIEELKILLDGMNKQCFRVDVQICSANAGIILVVITAITDWTDSPPSGLGYSIGSVVCGPNNSWRWTGTEWEKPFESGTYFFDKTTSTFYQYIEGTLTAVAKPNYTPGDCVTTRQCSSQCFQIVLCDDTVMLEATADSNCFGGYTGLNNAMGGGVMNWTNQMRVFAVVESDEIKREVNENSLGRVTKVTSTQQYNLIFTRGVPLPIIEVIVGIFASTAFTIDGISYNMTGTIQKNNNQGDSWYPRIAMDQRLCESSEGCN